MSEHEEVLTINEAAARLKVSRRVLYHWMASGKLPFRRTVGGSIRVNESDLWQP